MTDPIGIGVLGIAKVRLAIALSGQRRSTPSDRRFSHTAGKLDSLTAYRRDTLSISVV